LNWLLDGATLTLGLGVLKKLLDGGIVGLGTGALKKLLDGWTESLLSLLLDKLKKLLDGWTDKSSSFFILKKFIYGGNDGFTLGPGNNNPNDSIFLFCFIISLILEITTDKSFLESYGTKIVCH